MKESKKKKRLYLERAEELYVLTSHWFRWLGTSLYKSVDGNAGEVYL